MRFLLLLLLNLLSISLLNISCSNKTVVLSNKIENISVKKQGLHVDSISLNIFDDQKIRANNDLGIGEELYVNLYNIKQLSVIDSTIHIGYKINIAEKNNEKNKFEYDVSDNEIIIPEEPIPLDLYIIIGLDKRFISDLQYIATIKMFDYNNTDNNFEFSFDISINSELNLKQLETISNTTGITSRSSYFSINPDAPIPSKTNVFAYSSTAPYHLYYYIRGVVSENKSLNATSTSYLVRYIFDVRYLFDREQLHYVDYPNTIIGTRIQLNEEVNGIALTLKVGPLAQRGYGMGQYAICTIITDNNGENKMVNISNFYIVDKNNILHDIDYSRPNSQKHINLPKNGEAMLFGRSSREFNRYLKFFLLNLTEGTKHRSGKKTLIDINYTVDEAGKVKDVHVWNCESEWLKEQIITIAQGCPRWRPRTVDGIPSSSNLMTSLKIN